MLTQLIEYSLLGIAVYVILAEIVSTVKRLRSEKGDLDYDWTDQTGLKWKHVSGKWILIDKE